MSRSKMAPSKIPPPASSRDGAAGKQPPTPRLPHRRLDPAAAAAAASASFSSSRQPGFVRRFGERKHGGRVDKADGAPPLSRFPSPHKVTPRRLLQSHAAAEPARLRAARHRSPLAARGVPPPVQLETDNTALQVSSRPPGEHEAPEADPGADMFSPFGFPMGNNSQQQVGKGNDRMGLDS